MTLNYRLYVQSQENANDFKHLLKVKNNLRNANNITAKSRLDSLYNLSKMISNCNLLSTDKVTEISENIECACYSLIENQKEYNELIGFLKDQNLYQAVWEVLGGVPVDYVKLTTSILRISTISRS